MIVALPGPVHIHLFLIAVVAHRIGTPDMRQSKTLLTIDERGSKIARNSGFDCHLSTVGRQMAIETCY